MTNRNQQRQVDVWTKWDWLWKAIFYTTILVSFGLVLIDSNRATPTWVPGLLTVVMLVWHGGGLRTAYKGRTTWYERPTARFIIIIGDIVLWFVLVNISLAYYIALFGLFIAVFRHLPIRYAATATLLLTVATLFEQLADIGESFTLADPRVWLFFFVVLASLIFSIWISAIIEQSTRRRQLIDQLEAAQAELTAAERRAGVLEERQRLAREIHDTLAQGFTSIFLHLEAAEQALPADMDGLQKHLDLARSTARTSLDQARRVVQDLRPDLLEQQSLPDAIERTAARWRDETGIPITTNTTGSPITLHPNIEVTLLRATQEALNNILKHAQATTVQLTLSYMSDLVILDVQDNGVGLDGAEPSTLSGGYGLQAMQERAAHCGGFAAIESDPGEGTTVVVSIPLSN
ncbi:MAG: sensor histidine kinase [Chloroflexi bacterium]|nr:sensor histidine kinase [Chloroflexota bacterium]